MPTDIKDKNNDTAADVARISGHRETAELITNYKPSQRSKLCLGMLACFAYHTLILYTYCPVCLWMFCDDIEIQAEFYLTKIFYFCC